MGSIEVFLITFFITKKGNTNLVCNKLDRNTSKEQNPEQHRREKNASKLAHLRLCKVPDL